MAEGRPLVGEEGPNPRSEESGMGYRTETHSSGWALRAGAAGRGSIREIQAAELK